MRTSSTDCVSRGHSLIGTQFMPLDGKRVELPLQLVLVDGLVLVCMQAWGSAQPAGLCDVDNVHAWMHACIHGRQHLVSTACTTGRLVRTRAGVHACMF